MARETSDILIDLGISRESKARDQVVLKLSLGNCHFFLELGLSRRRFFVGVFVYIAFYRSESCLIGDEWLN